MGQQRFYSSTAVQTTLAASLGAVSSPSTGQSVHVTSVSGFPTHYPFTMLLEWGTSNQEVVTVTQAATGSGPYVFANCVRGDDGTSAPAHSNGAAVYHGVSARDYYQSPSVFNVCDYGADPTGTTECSAAINACIAAASAAGFSSIPGGAGFATVYFPAGTYLVGTTLNLAPVSTLTSSYEVYTSGEPWAGNLRIQGESVNNTIIQGTAALTSALAAVGSWISNTAAPIYGWQLDIAQITFNGGYYPTPTSDSPQQSGTPYGVVLQSFQCSIEYCQFSNTGSDALRYDASGANGTNNVQGGCPENHIFRCQFNSDYGNIVGNDIATNETWTGSVYTDGFIEDCIFSSAGKNSISINALAGWHIGNNHFYGSGESAIAGALPYYTRIIGNYVEGAWGQSATAGVYCAIDFWNGGVNDTGNGSVIANNVIFCPEGGTTPDLPGNQGSALYGIALVVDSGQTPAAQATMTITGNVLLGWPDSSLSGTDTQPTIGIALGTGDSTGIVNVFLDNNNMTGSLSGGTPAYMYWNQNVVTNAPGISGNTGNGGGTYNVTRGVQSLGAATAAVTVANTTTITSLGSMTIFPGELCAGSAYRFRLYGTISTYSTAPTPTLDIRLGGTGGTLITSLVGGTSTPAFATSLSAVPILIEGEVEVQSTSSTAANCLGWLRMTWANGGVTATDVTALKTITSTVSHTLPTANSELLTVDWTWNLAETANTITIASSVFERVA